MSQLNKSSMKINMLISAVLASLLAGLSISSSAFDLQGTLKDAAKKQIEEQLGQSTNSQQATTPDNQSATTPTPADSTAPDSVSSTIATTAETPQATINWKNPSTAEEIALGREITGNLLGAAPLVKNEALQKYVNSVGRWVASQSERPDLPWHFGVIESDDLNAFAAPGGYVMITKGLYKKMSNEAQLAGVLGHEIGHVVAKHQLKVLQKQQLLNLGAGFLNKKIGKDNKIISQAIGSGAEISARSLDKSAEFEADRLGLSYATRSGYEPFGLTDILQLLGQTGKNDNSVALLFKTHPHPDERLATLGNSVGSKLDNIKNGKTLENRFYQLK
ncbi:M48 family metallopeptidase [Methylotenera sp.]|uniref:M48 family metallopeptidase n=3 Tax=Methylotenera sp. TaxID=2051956 RepID=UPI00272432A3|nr:M48 family metalloprotease [Methylotenera sp.]MDO9205999.1 M48 family metalloprotease [Methylotenera sp.]MDP1522658.1 M48 family metalloprotease [Methylotenera sp.]MDP2071907.1 M48 family metalloprotease [Methylotenera sp.]MDP2230754.1 M48 family metalloprotease [Methylotenera sp.]MDP3005532.1 M48 family metalloprotease [Methylotenera sp.]